MNNEKCYRNVDCKYFPCHTGIELEEFNCLFCYCPFYFLGKECNGNYNILDSGVKDCSNCTFPHYRKNYDVIVSRLKKDQIEKILDY